MMASESKSVLEDAAALSLIDISEKDIATAEQYKNDANKLFQSKNYSQAIDKYTFAISHNPSVASYYSNRAFAYIKTELYGAAIRDAEKSIALDPLYVKGYYRRAVGHMALGQFKEAVNDFKCVVKTAPSDRDAREKLTECMKEYKRRLFEEAIAAEVEASAIDSIDFANLNVVSDYTGPRLDDGEITLDFVMGLMELYKKQGKLPSKYTYMILKKSRDLMQPLSSIIDIPVPQGKKITVCGDIHGQFYDLMHIFERNGVPSEDHMYLFNGDFVDRGSFSVECIMTLLSFKLLYPNSLHLSRGNHETNDMNKVYGFEGEVKAKYNDNAFKMFSEVFNAVPLGQVIGGKILVVHGGLFSRDDVTLDELRSINRFKQPGNTGLMCELLWSDPQHAMGRSPSKRGVGIQFGPDITKAFLERNNLDLLIRSHEVQQEGYSRDHDGKCITIFSAPNYCDSVGNKGAYINIYSSLELEFVEFTAVPHPTNVKAMQYAGKFFGGMM